MSNCYFYGEGGVGVKNLLDSFHYVMAIDRARAIEERITLMLRPKPRWLPRSAWRWLITRLIFIESKKIR